MLRDLARFLSEKRVSGERRRERIAESPGSAEVILRARAADGRLFLIASFLKVPVQFFVEGLEQIPPVEILGDRSGRESNDLALLDDAFLSISDLDKRRSLLALVCALAGPESAPGRRT